MWALVWWPSILPSVHSQSSCISSWNSYAPLHSIQFVIDRRCFTRDVCDAIFVMFFFHSPLSPRFSSLILYQYFWLIGLIHSKVGCSRRCYIWRFALRCLSAPDPICHPRFSVALYSSASPRGVCFPLHRPRLFASSLIVEAIEWPLWYSIFQSLPIMTCTTATHTEHTVPPEITDLPTRSLLLFDKPYASLLSLFVFTFPSSIRLPVMQKDQISVFDCPL